MRKAYFIIVLCLLFVVALLVVPFPETFLGCIAQIDITGGRIRNVYYVFGIRVVGRAENTEVSRYLETIFGTLPPPIWEDFAVTYGSRKVGYVFSPVPLAMQELIEAVQYENFSPEARRKALLDFLALLRRGAMRSDSREVEKATQYADKIRVLAEESREKKGIIVTPDMLPDPNTLVLE